MTHPNGANAITAVSYVAEDPAELVERFTGIYGKDAITVGAGYLKAQTDRGVFEVLSPICAEHRFAGVDVPVTHNQLPSGVAIRVSTGSMAQAKSHLDAQRVNYVETTDGGLRIPAYYAGNTIIEIYPA